MGCVRVVDLQCPVCRAVAYDEVVPRNDTRSCPVCLTDAGSPVMMVVFWGGKQSRSRMADGFVPIIAGFKRYSTREEWQAYQKTMRKQTGKDLEFEGQTPTGRKNAFEDHVTTTLDEYRANGMDYDAAAKRFERHAERAWERSRSGIQR